MLIPTIHRNGTAKETLIEDYCAIRSALVDSIRIMVNRGPNGRDYYPQGENAIAQAVEEHTARVNSLIAIQYEIEQIIDGIDRQEC